MNALATAVPDLAEARRPAEAAGFRRDQVRLLVARAGGIAHTRFAELPTILSPGDLVVVNTSRTLPASLSARRGDGGEVTFNLSTPVPYEEEGGRWVVELRRGGSRARDGRAGEVLTLPGGGRAELLAPYLGSRLWVASLTLPAPPLDYLGEHGEPIRYGHLEGEWPLSAHQNVYAAEPGSAEMPSAGRPFTTEIIAALVARGVDVAPVVLHTGVSSLESNENPYPERFSVPGWTADRANLARRLGGRVIAVGTTVVRALESAARADGSLAGRAGWTDLVVGPERPVRAVDGLLTGFHDSDSSHLRMLEAIVGPEFVARSYRAAAEAGYLRHEFGDVELLLP